LTEAYAAVPLKSELEACSTGEPAISLSSLTIHRKVQLGQSEVDQIDLAAVALKAEGEVGGLDVAMNIPTVVQVLNGVEHLELPVAVKLYQELKGEDGRELFVFHFLDVGQVFAYRVKGFPT